MKTKIVSGGKGINLNGEPFRTESYTGKILMMDSCGIQEGALLLRVVFEDHEELSGRMEIYHTSLKRMRKEMKMGALVAIKEIVIFHDFSFQEANTREIVLC